MPSTRRPLADCRLYSFVDSGYLHGRDPADVCRALCAGGSDLVQLRAKDWPEDRITRTAAALLDICDAAGVWFVVNDHPGIAAQVGAPLVHLGQEDFFDAGASHAGTFLQTFTAPTSREHRPPGAGRDLRLGLSSHAPDQAERAVASGAAYVAVGPVFATATKPGRPPVTLDYVRWAARHLARVPWFAIGGLNLTTLDEVLAAGATRICVVSAILDAHNLTAACQEFRRRLG